MGKEDIWVLRPKLLSVNGIGPETADSILLYAFDKPIFVVDAYTRRLLYRHNFIAGNEDYHAVQEKFTRSLDCNAQIFNEYHALIVRLGKEYCKPKPLCGQCLLNNFHYSLTRKCGKCHRALLKTNDRKIDQNHYVCRKCHAD
jgi:endonuclease-3 related protein